VPTTLPTAHGALVAAIEDMARAQRETGAWLSRAVDCGRGGLAVLRVLERGPHGVGDVAHALRVDVSVASRQVAALADAGLVERDVAADDRRVRTVVLTDAGRALAARHASTAQDLAARVFADWSDDEIDAAATQFRKVADAVVRHQRHLTPAAPAAPEVAPVTPAVVSPESPEREIA
jgi:DNA-binding MarR family transcriptional regulator